MVRLWVLVVAVLAVLPACSDPTEGKFGAELYEISCARCHGTDGSGIGTWPPVGPGSSTMLLDDDQIRGVIRVGPGTMSAYPQLTDEQVDSLVLHLRLLQQRG